MNIFNSVVGLFLLILLIPGSANASSENILKSINTEIISIKPVEIVQKIVHDRLWIKQEKMERERTEYQTKWHGLEECIEKDPDDCPTTGGENTYLGGFLDGYIHRNGKIYFYNHFNFSDQGRLLLPAHAKTFEYPQGWDYENEYLETFSDYGRDIQKIFYRDKVIPGADPKTFTVLPEHYAKDQHHVYYENLRIKGADSKTFYLLTDASAGYYGVGADANNVYFHEKKMVGASPATFQEFPEWNIYFKSADAVFYEHLKIEGADVESFVLLNWTYSKDKHHAYYKNKIITDADAETFEDDWDYAKDKNHVYFEGKRIQGPDPETFKVEYGYYATDKQYAYYKGKVIQGANPEAFVALISPPQCSRSDYCQYDYATDGENFYRAREKIGVLDSETFEWKWRDIPKDEKTFITKYLDFDIKNFMP